MDIRILTFAACLIAGPAFASCSQSDIAGMWNAYSVGATDGTSYWVKCSFTVESNGTIAEGSSSCVTNGGASSKLSGSIRVKSASECTFSGSIKIIADSEVDEISEVTLNRDHNSASGVGISPVNGFSFTLVRN
jgi:hypothetical protein